MCKCEGIETFLFSCAVSCGFCVDPFQLGMPGILCMWNALCRVLLLGERWVQAPLQKLLHIKSKGGPSHSNLYTDQIWSNSQVLKILTVKRDKKQMKKYWNGLQKHSSVTFCPHKRHDLISRINRSAFVFLFVRTSKKITNHSKTFGAPELKGWFGKALAQVHNFLVGTWKMVVHLS